MKRQQFTLRLCRQNARQPGWFVSGGDTPSYPGIWGSAAEADFRRHGSLDGRRMRRSSGAGTNWSCDERRTAWLDRGLAQSRARVTSGPKQGEEREVLEQRRKYSGPHRSLSLGCDVIKVANGRCSRDLEPWLQLFDPLLLFLFLFPPPPTLC